MQIATFAINYQGRPFRESLTENKPLWLAIRIVGSILVTSALQVFPFINGWMELVDMPVLVGSKSCWLSIGLTLTSVVVPAQAAYRHGFGRCFGVAR